MTATATATISTATVQKALHVLRSGGKPIPSPGTIDGRWGPATAASLKAWLMTEGRADAFVPLEGTDQLAPADMSFTAAFRGALNIQLDRGIAQTLARYADLYNARSGPAPGPDGTGTPRPQDPVAPVLSNRRTSTEKPLWPWIAGGAAVLVLVALVTRRRRG